MEELPVGAEVTLKVVEAYNCDCCFFCHDDTCYNPTYNGWGDGFQCEPKERSDGKNVIFKEVKK